MGPLTTQLLQVVPVLLAAACCHIWDSLLFLIEPFDLFASLTDYAFTTLTRVLLMILPTWKYTKTFMSPRAFFLTADM